MYHEDSLPEWVRTKLDIHYSVLPYEVKHFWETHSEEVDADTVYLVIERRGRGVHFYDCVMVRQYPDMVWLEVSNIF